jgi:glycogen synthase
MPKPRGYPCPVRGDPSPMRIVMVSWEYPPLFVGGLATHVHGIATAMVRSGHDVVVLTFQHPDAPDDAVIDGVRILRASTDLPWFPDDQFVSKMISANHQLVQLSTKLGSDWKPEIVHVHDWLSGWAGDTLSALWSVPMVATIHATERGRNGGVVPTNGQSASIHSAEWWLTFRADRVICCSQFMAQQIADSFEVPAEKLVTIHNAVDAALWTRSIEPEPTEMAGPLIVSWGRVQYEKGFQTLVEAMPILRERLPGVRVVIAGTGSYRAELAERAEAFGVADLVHFAGFVPADELAQLLQAASCVVIPSFYEPFGIVALETLAAGAPLVAARTGGMAEVLDDADAGLLFTPGDAKALADAVTRTLTDADLRTRQTANGLNLVHQHYSWDAVAAHTINTYQKVLA